MDHRHPGSSGNVADLLRVAAGRFPDRVAVLAPGEAWTWADLGRAADRARRRFAEIGAPGDRVVVALPTSSAALVTMFGLAAAGRVAVPVAAGSPELPTVAGRVGAVAAVGTALAGSPFVGAEEILGWFGADEQPPGGTEVPTGPGGEDLAMLARSTAPHPVMISHRAILAAVEAIVAAPALSLRADDRALLVLPLSHLAGWVTAFLPLTTVGAAAVIPVEPAGPGEWLDGVLDAVRTHRVTVIPASPSLYRRLGVPNVERALASVRLMTSAAAPLDAADAATIRSVTGLSVWEGYGIAESTSAVASSLMTHAPRRGSVGKPLPGVELRILTDEPDQDEPEPTAAEADSGDPEPTEESAAAAAPERKEPPAEPDVWAPDLIAEVPGDGEPGRITLRGPTLFSGYWPDGSGGPDDDGWFVTGDVGYLDDADELHLVDRIAESVQVAGFTVFPREVETVLTQHPYVRDAAVIGVPGRAGEAMLAVLVPQRGTHPTAADLDEFVAGRLPVFKRPAHYRLVDRLPRTAVGRIDRDIVRQNYLADPDPMPPIRMAASSDNAKAEPAPPPGASERLGSTIRTLILRLPRMSRPGGTGGSPAAPEPATPSAPPAAAEARDDPAADEELF